MAASFPSSVKSWTPVVDDTDEVLAAHMNDIYEEVLAIEDDIIDNTGWRPANETWTYASASTITVASGAASRYQKGDKIKWTQTTVKYGVIITVADTLLTIAINTEYTVADAAISDNYVSRIENPFGYPGWFPFSLTVNGDGGSAGTFSLTSPFGIYSIHGKTCTFNIFGVIGNKGSWSGTVRIVLPVARYDTNVATFSGYFVISGGNPATQSRGYPRSGDVTYINFYNSTYVSNLAWSGVSNNDSFEVSGSYRI